MENPATDPASASGTKAIVFIGSLPFVREGEPDETAARRAERLDKAVGDLVERVSERSESGRIGLKLMWVRKGPPVRMNGTLATANEVFLAVLETLGIREFITGGPAGVGFLFLTDAPLGKDSLALAFGQVLVTSTDAVGALRRRLGGDPWPTVVMMTLARRAIAGSPLDPFRPTALQMPIQVSAPGESHPSAPAEAETGYSPYESQDTERDLAWLEVPVIKQQKGHASEEME